MIEPWIDELSRDPVADLDCDPRLQRSWQHAPFLFVQLLAVAGEIDVAQAVAALRREIGNAFRGTRLPWPLPNAIVALVLGLCVEFGVATWDGTIAKPGRARITQLGALAELAYRAHLGIDTDSTFVPGCPTCAVTGFM